MNAINLSLFKRRICFIVFVSLKMSSAFSQKEITSFQIIDEKTKAPIQFSSVIVKGKNTSAQSNQFGITKIQAKTTDTLIIYQLGYFIKKITLADIIANNRVILLKSKNLMLDEVVINYKKTDTLQASSNSVFLDFDFYDNYILTLVHKGKKYNSLMILDLDGNKISEKYLSIKTEKLFKDCFENIHLLTSDSVYQVYYNYQNITLLKPFAIKSYYNLLKPCECQQGTKYIFKSVHYQKLKNSYYVFDDRKKQNKELLVTVADSSAINGFNTDFDINYFLSQRRQGFAYATSVDEIKKNIDQLREDIPLSAKYRNMLRPAESEMKKLDSNFVLIDYTNKFMYWYSLEAKLISKQLLTDFKEIIPKVYIDYDFHTLIFSRMDANGLLTLYKYDRMTNKFTHQFELQNFYFIKNFKIKENNLFFIGKDRASELTKSKIIKQLISWEKI